MKEKGLSPAAAFLLVQLGAYAADRFGERIAPLRISPRQAGILRLIATTPACNQQDLARRLGILPSQMVFLIDELSEKNLVERQRSTQDRRVSFVRLTNKGKRLMEKLSTVVQEHGQEFCSALTAKELRTLHLLCSKLADTHGISPGVHPGYRKLFRERKSIAGSETER